VRREHRKLTRREIASITSSRPVRRKVSRRRDDARKNFYPSRKHMFVPSERRSRRWI
jgi:hypothetical protein